MDQTDAPVFFWSIKSSRLRSCQESHALALFPSRLVGVYTTLPRPEEHQSSPRKPELHGQQSSPGGNAAWMKLPRISRGLWLTHEETSAASAPSTSGSKAPPSSGHSRGKRQNRKSYFKITVETSLGGKTSL